MKTRKCFIFSQDTQRKNKVLDYLCTINEIEKRSGLDFLRELPDDREELIQGNFMEIGQKTISNNERLIFIHYRINP